MSRAAPPAAATALLPAAATAASRGTATSAVVGLPPLSPDALSAAIAGLPDAEASGALIQVRGTAGGWSGSSGVSSVRAQRAPALDGRFRIGSMTKVFTAIVTLQLAAERRLDLDAPIQRYLPGLLPASYSPITARQLLTWTSGLNGVDVPAKTPDWYFAHRFDHWTPGSQLDLTKPLAFPPGTQQRYGNVDYIAAGLLIERVTGHSWAEEVTRRIIRPLRLTGTSVPGDDIRVPGPHAHGYEATSDGWVDVTLANPSLQWSAASIISTADDLDRLMVALFRGRLVPQPQLEAMFTVPDVPTYGSTGRAVYSAGLTKFQLGEVTVWAKSGDRPGYNNGMGATRDLSRRLVYSVNTLHMGGLDQPQVAQRIILATF
ncbi:MAG TPA: serine hydrolase domain-containing protein [Actinoplanes sp.]|nr:serine hydrolase domain-containing protein [Actinoplanes sp.]